MFKMVSLTNKPCDDGQPVMSDHTVQEFKVVIRSMSSIHPDTLKNLIQNKYEVIKCEEVAKTSYVIPM